MTKINSGKEKKSRSEYKKKIFSSLNKMPLSILEQVLYFCTNLSLEENYEFIPGTFKPDKGEKVRTVIFRKVPDVGLRYIVKNGKVSVCP